MAYDRYVESMRLIEHGPVDVAKALSRRRRFAPLDVDVFDDVAVTLFARRGVSGLVEVEAWTLERRTAGWQLLGGGSGPADDGTLGDRPPARQLGGRVQQRGGGSTARSFEDLRPSSERYIEYAELRVAAEVDSLLVRGKQRRAPRHGNVVVILSRAQSEVTLLARGGSVLKTVELGAQFARGWRQFPTVYGSGPLQADAGGAS